jgi:hypothetical protein
MVSMALKAIGPPLSLNRWQDGMSDRPEFAFLIFQGPTTGLGFD